MVQGAYDIFSQSMHQKDYSRNNQKKEESEGGEQEKMRGRRLKGYGCGREETPRDRQVRPKVDADPGADLRHFATLVVSLLPSPSLVQSLIHLIFSPPLLLTNPTGAWIGKKYRRHAVQTCERNRRSRQPHTRGCVCVRVSECTSTCHDALSLTTWRVH